MFLDCVRFCGAFKVTCSFLAITWYMVSTSSNRTSESNFKYVLIFKFKPDGNFQRNQLVIVLKLNDIVKFTMNTMRTNYSIVLYLDHKLNI